MYEYFVAVSVLGVLIGAVSTAYVSASFGMIIIAIGFLCFCISLYNLQYEKEQNSKDLFSKVKHQVEKGIKSLEEGYYSLY